MAREAKAAQSQPTGPPPPRPAQPPPAQKFEKDATLKYSNDKINKIIEEGSNKLNRNELEQKRFKYVRLYKKHPNILVEDIDKHEYEGSIRVLRNTGQMGDITATFTLGIFDEEDMVLAEKSSPQPQTSPQAEKAMKQSPQPPYPRYTPEDIKDGDNIPATRDEAQDLNDEIDKVNENIAYLVEESKKLQQKVKDNQGKLINITAKGLTVTPNNTVPVADYYMYKTSDHFQALIPLHQFDDMEEDKRQRIQGDAKWEKNSKKEWYKKNTEPDGLCFYYSLEYLRKIFNDDMTTAQNYRDILSTIELNMQDDVFQRAITDPRIRKDDTKWILIKRKDGTFAGITSDAEDAIWGARANDTTKGYNSVEKSQFRSNIKAILPNLSRSDPDYEKAKEDAEEEANKKRNGWANSAACVLLMYKLNPPKRLSLYITDKEKWETHGPALVSELKEELNLAIEKNKNQLELLNTIKNIYGKDGDVDEQFNDGDRIKYTQDTIKKLADIKHDEILARIPQKRRYFNDNERKERDNYIDEISDKLFTKVRDDNDNEGYIIIKDPASEEEKSVPKNEYQNVIRAGQTQPQSSPQPQTETVSGEDQEQDLLRRLLISTFQDKFTEKYKFIRTIKTDEFDLELTEIKSTEIVFPGSDDEPEILKYFYTIKSKDDDIENFKTVFQPLISKLNLNPRKASIDFALAFDDDISDIEGIINAFNETIDNKTLLNYQGEKVFGGTITDISNGNWSQIVDENGWCQVKFNDKDVEDIIYKKARIAHDNNKHFGRVLDIENNTRAKVCIDQITNDLSVNQGDIDSIFKSIKALYNKKKEENEDLYVVYNSKDDRNKTFVVKCTGAYKNLSEPKDVGIYGYLVKKGKYKNIAKDIPIEKVIVQGMKIRIMNGDHSGLVETVLDIDPIQEKYTINIGDKEEKISIQDAMGIWCKSVLESETIKHKLNNDIKDLKEKIKNKDTNPEDIEQINKELLNKLQEQIIVDPDNNSIIDNLILENANHPLIQNLQDKMTEAKAEESMSKWIKIQEEINEIKKKIFAIAALDVENRDEKGEEGSDKGGGEEDGDRGEDNIYGEDNEEVSDKEELTFDDVITVVFEKDLRHNINIFDKMNKTMDIEYKNITNIIASDSRIPEIQLNENFERVVKIQSLQRYNSKVRYVLAFDLLCKPAMNIRYTSPATINREHLRYIFEMGYGRHIFDTLQGVKSVNDINEKLEIYVRKIRAINKRNNSKVINMTDKSYREMLFDSNKMQFIHSTYPFTDSVKLPGRSRALTNTLKKSASHGMKVVNTVNPQIMLPTSSTKNYYEKNDKLFKKYKDLSKDFSIVKYTSQLRKKSYLPYNYKKYYTEEYDELTFFEALKESVRLLAIDNDKIDINTNLLKEELKKVNKFAKINILLQTKLTDEKREELLKNENAEDFAKEALNSDSDFFKYICAKYFIPKQGSIIIYSNFNTDHFPTKQDKGICVFKESTYYKALRWTPKENWIHNIDNIIKLQKDIHDNPKNYPDAFKKQVNYYYDLLTSELMRSPRRGGRPGGPRGKSSDRDSDGDDPSDSDSGDGDDDPSDGGRDGSGSSGESSDDSDGGPGGGGRDGESSSSSSDSDDASDSDGGPGGGGDGGRGGRLVTIIVPTDAKEGDVINVRYDDKLFATKLPPGARPNGQARVRIDPRNEVKGEDDEASDEAINELIDKAMTYEKFEKYTNLMSIEAQLEARKVMFAQLKKVDKEKVENQSKNDIIRENDFLNKEIDDAFKVSIRTGLSKQAALEVGTKIDKDKMPENVKSDSTQEAYNTFTKKYNDEVEKANNKDYANITEIRIKKILREAINKGIDEANTRAAAKTGGAGNNNNTKPSTTHYEGNWKYF